MNALVLKGPQWAVDSLAEDSMRNRDFWSKQEVECAVDIDTGITKWVFGGLTRCEPRTCLLLPTMLSANNILLEYNRETVWNGSSNASMPLRVPAVTEATYVCPSGKEVTEYCSSKRYIPDWISFDGTCTGMIFLSRIHSLICPFIFVLYFI